MQATFVDLTATEAVEIRQLGENAINRLGTILVREVSNAIAKDGPEGAVEVCHLKSLPMTNGTVDGLPRTSAVKLTSLKLRNPANAPDAAEQLALDQIQQQLNNGDAPAPLLVQRIEHPAAAPEWRVYKPLGIMAKCLKCHGDPAAQSDELRAKLNALYPGDQATGFNAGEWRGLIRVTIDNKPPTPPAKPTAKAHP